MSDREKAIKGLNECITVLSAHVPERYIGYSVEACFDAIELLKELEPVKTEPVRFKIVRAGGSNYPFWDCVCDGCGFKTSEVHMNWRFCPGCGKAVKLDG